MNQENKESVDSEYKNNQEVYGESGSAEEDEYYKRSTGLSPVENKETVSELLEDIDQIDDSTTLAKKKKNASGFDEYNEYW